MAPILREIQLRGMIDIAESGSWEAHLCVYQGE